MRVWTSNVLPLTSLIPVRLSWYKFPCTSRHVLTNRLLLLLLLLRLPIVFWVWLLAQGRGVESLSNNMSISAFRNNFVECSPCWHRTVYDGCVGEGIVSWPHLLGEAAQGILLLNLGKEVRRVLQELLEVDWGIHQKEDEGDRRDQGSQRTRSLHAWMRSDKYLDILSHAMCATNECNNTRLRRLTTMRTFTCLPSVSRHCRVSCAFCWCYSGSWFSRCRWCRTSHRSAGRFYTVNFISPRIRNSKYKVLFFWMLSVRLLSCHRQLNLHSQILAYFTFRETRVFWQVLSSQWLRVTSSARNCNPSILYSGKFYLSKRHLDYVSNDCDSALSEEWCNHHEVLHRNLHQKGRSGVKKMVCRHFVAFLSTRKLVRSQG